MKYFGCKSEYNNQRTQDLLKAYFQYLHSCSHVFLPDVYKNVANMPASRFWVSERRAAIVVASISRGDKLLYMRENKRQMYFEIYRRVQELRHRHPGWSTHQLVRSVIAQPAPCFYLTPGSVRAFIIKAKKQYFARLSDSRANLRQKHIHNESKN